MYEPLPRWVFERPSTTIVGSFRPEIVAAPGYRKAGDGPRQNAPGSVQVTVEQASALQGFPSNYPWQGSKTKVRQQIGNAVPPLLARAILTDITEGLAMPKTAVDLFAGPGGWDVAARDLGIEVTGIEFDHAACETRRAAGLPTIEGDVTHYGPTDFPADGLIASPPCQTFSMAGNGSGRRALDDVLLGVKELSQRQPLTVVHDDPRTGLVLEPLRWALEAIDAGRPYRWLAFEQVPTVLPVWEAIDEVLEAEGYSSLYGYIHAEQYGVPQTRKRAVLIARLDGPVTWPKPTHSRYYPHDPKRLDDGVQPWVTMAEALGWGFTNRPSGTTVSQSNGGRRLLDGGSGAWKGVLRAVEAGQWIRRPDRLHLPLNRGEVSTTPVSDGAILQTFPANYPWSGWPTTQAKQVGNAVPPMLAKAILSTVTR